MRSSPTANRWRCFEVAGGLTEHLDVEILADGEPLALHQISEQNNDRVGVEILADGEPLALPITADGVIDVYKQLRSSPTANRWRCPDQYTLLTA